ncbi:MAG: acyl carrier protein [Dorea sp.]|nr:acyl carrier protein [Dorea sp.]
MDRDVIKQKVIEICKDIFEDDRIDITENLCSSNIDRWDSLVQLNILGDIEDEFDIRFSLDETMSLKSIKELVDAIESKIK